MTNRSSLPRRRLVPALALLLIWTCTLSLAAASARSAETTPGDAGFASTLFRARAGDAPRGGGWNATAAAGGDFDEDGVPDMIAGVERGGRAALVLYRGNGGANYPSHPLYRDQGDAPFLPSPATFDASAPVNVVATGDMDADGHLDAVTAARGDDRLFVFRGDGRGGLAAPYALDLPGRVVALAAGEFGRADGLQDVGVSIDGPDGFAALVFSGPDGAATAEPVRVALPAAAPALAFGRVDEASYGLVAGSGDRVIVAELRADGHVATTSLDAGAVVRSVAVGRFGDAQIAALGDGGRIDLIRFDEDANAKGDAPRLVARPSATVAAGPASRLVRLGGGASERLVVADPDSDSLSAVDTDTGVVTALGRWERASGTAAALARRVDSGAADGVVVLPTNGAAPVAIAPKVSAPITVTNTDDSGEGSLRWAIEQANVSMAPAQIAFAIDGPGPYTLHPASQYPYIDHPVTIDAETQSGFAGTPIVKIDGTNIVAAPMHSTICFYVSSPNCVVRGFEIDNAGIAVYAQYNSSAAVVEGNWIGVGATAGIDGNAVSLLGEASMLGGTSPAARNVVANANYYGVTVFGAGTLVQGNYVGVDPTGASARPNVVGIYCSAQDTIIGGTAPGARNVISGNLNGGVIVEAPGYGSLVQGNYVGTDATGSVAVPNGGIGVETRSAQGTTVGGTTPAARNVLSGNASHGVYLTTGYTSEIFVQGNYVGLGADGATPIGNGGNGVFVNAQDSAYVGGKTVGARNVVSANAGDGIHVSSYEVYVEGNYVGTDVTGTLARGNGGFGIVGGGAGALGGTDPGAPNVVAANGGGGIWLPNEYVPVYGNRVGVSVTGAPLGNHGDGVLLGSQGSNGGFRNNSVGGTAPGQGNDIRFNTGNGVSVIRDAGQKIVGNRIASNGGIAIDLNQDGPTPNDAGDLDNGPNELFNTPTLVSARVDGATTRVAATLDTRTSRSCRVDFYSASACGEADRYLGGVAATTDATNGHADVAFSFPESLAGSWITATATDSEYGTSELSACLQVTGAASGADLGVSVAASPSSVVSGAQLSFTISVTNAGPETATATTVTAATPAGTTFVSVSTSQGSGVGPAPGGTGQVVCSLGDLASGATATATVVLTATAPAGSSVTLSATAASARPDPVAGNDTASRSVAVVAPGGGMADVALTISGPTGPVASGATVTYTLTVSNAGSAPAVAVAVAIAVPADATFVGFAAADGTWTAPVAGGTGAVDWSIGELAPGASTSATFAVAVSAPPGAVVTLSGEATTDSADAVPANDAATYAVTVAAGSPQPSVSRVVAVAGPPFRLKVLGTGFEPGIQVFLGADAVPWQNVVLKSGQKLVIKEGGSLKRRFPKGVLVQIRIANPDGGSATTSFTR